MNFDMEKFNLWNLINVEVRKQYQVKISNRLAALENLDDDDDDDDDDDVHFNRAGKSIRTNIQASNTDSISYELKQLKILFDEERSKLLDGRKWAKLQCLQNSSQTNGNNLNNVSCEARIIFRNKEREYLEAKINKLETNSKNKNIRYLYKGINVFKNCYLVSCRFPHYF
jgi:hypothetical protein